MKYRVLLDFVRSIENNSDVEIYNEAGLQHELCWYLRQQFAGKYKIELEKDLQSHFGCADFCKKEADIIITDRQKPTKTYVIEIKVTHARSIPDRIYNVHQDVLFLEQLREKGVSKGLYCFSH